MSTSIFEPGTRLGKYEVLAHVATGGMGAVYKAIDRELRRIVALKVLLAERAQVGTGLERFRREARHAARLNHPNIVTLYEYGYSPDHDVHYLVLEYVEGIDLLTHIERKGQLPPRETRRILIQAARALGHAYEQGVVHRDIKPSNFLLTRVGEKVVVKLTDLGLAFAASETDFKVTRDGNTVGTIDYMSPEQAHSSRSVDIRSDIYSLGCMAYHLLAGHPPFAQGGLGERVYKHMEVPPTDVRRFSPTVSASFWGILTKMLAKNPEQRYATPNELLADLKRTQVEMSAEEPEPAEEPDTLSNDDTAGLVTPEQKQAAAAFHERAVQVLAEGGGEDYARQLLDNCLKLDPLTPEFRQTLRELNRKASAGMLGRWFGSLNVLTIKTRMHAARRAGDWRKVFECGEDLLAQNPADVDTHIELSEVAAAMGQSDLAMWFLSQGREAVRNNSTLMRATARMLEKRQEWRAALAVWARVRRIEPDDPEAREKMNDLAVQLHIEKRQYGRWAEQKDE